MDPSQDRIAKVRVAGSNPVVRSKKGPVVRSTVVRPSPAEIAFSVATVDVGAMIDSQDCDGYCLIVDLVDHSVRSPTSCP